MLQLSNSEGVQQENILDFICGQFTLLFFFKTDDHTLVASQKQEAVWRRTEMAEAN